MNNLPLKRHKAIQNLSREHHDSLVFVLRLQKGIAKKANIKEMSSYIDWFWTSHLSIHFKLEETHLFPKYGLENTLIKRALDEHKHIQKLIQHQPQSYDNITQLYKTLKSHIRFEERELFMRIQQELSEEDLAEFGNIHTKQLDCGLWVNRFWE
jgi:hemerythrin-like domain-containing protein